jgi:hypothetical protein
MDKELERIWREAAMVCFKVPYPQLSSLTEENHEKPGQPAVAVEWAR